VLAVADVVRLPPPLLGLRPEIEPLPVAGVTLARN
jgi:hypothetical protein